MGLVLHVACGEGEDGQWAMGMGLGLGLVQEQGLAGL